MSFWNIKLLKLNFEGKTGFKAREGNKIQSSMVSIDLELEKSLTNGSAFYLFFLNKLTLPPPFKLNTPICLINMVKQLS